MHYAWSECAIVDCAIERAIKHAIECVIGRALSMRSVTVPLSVPSSVPSYRFVERVELHKLGRGSEPGVIYCFPCGFWLSGQQHSAVLSVGYAAHLRHDDVIIARQESASPMTPAITSVWEAAPRTPISRQAQKRSTRSRCSLLPIWFLSKPAAHLEQHRSISSTAPLGGALEILAAKHDGAVITSAPAMGLLPHRPSDCEKSLQGTCGLRTEYTVTVQTGTSRILPTSGSTMMSCTL